MKKSLLIFLAAGCAFLLVVLIVLIWYMIRKRREKNKHGSKSTPPRRKTTVIAPPDFELPLPYQTIPVQMGLSDYEQTEDENGFQRSVGTNGRRVGTMEAPYSGGSESETRKRAHLPVRKISTESARLWRSTPDIRAAAAVQPDRITDDEAERQKRSSLTRLSASTDKRRKISLSVMEQLKTHGKRVSALEMPAIVTQGSTFTESVPPEGRRVSSLKIEDCSASFGRLSEDSVESDASALSSDNEVYSNPSVDQKKRIGRRRGESRDKKIFRKSGKLVFSTAYIADEQKLQVEIIRAMDIGRRFSTNDVNSFVRVYLLPGKLQKQHTKAQKKSKDPHFYETLTFQQISSDDFKKYRIKLKVYNSRGHLGKNDLLGEVDMALSSLDTSVKETFEVDLFVSRAESTQSQLMVSLSHQAAFSKLQVSILKAKNLPKTRLTGSPDPYVVIVLCRDSGNERRETKAKRNSRNPVYNENFEFDVTTNSSLPLSTFSLVVTVVHHSLVGKDEILGHVIFSLDSPQRSAMEHWRAVSQSPHRPAHAEWHQLLDPDDL